MLKQLRRTLLIILSIITVSGCADKTEVASKEVVAKVNGEEITKEDLNFYQLINTMQIEMYRDADKKKYTGTELEQAMKYWDAQEKDAKSQNLLLTQVIRLRAVALLAKEKGHQASADEVKQEIEKVKEIYKQQPVAMKMIQDYGEEKFWQQQQVQYERIVLAGKVQKDVIDNVKKANPKAQAKEVNMLAEKKYEELLVSQMGTLKIEIMKK